VSSTARTNRSEHDEEAQPKNDDARLLKSLRDKYSWTQSEIGEKLGIEQSYVSSIETGHAPLSKKVREKLSNLAETDLKFGKWLLEQRTKRGWSRADLASRAGISELTIFYIESGKTESPQKATLAKLEKVFGKLPESVHAEISEESLVLVPDPRGAGARFGLGEYLGPFAVEEWESNVTETTPGIYVFYDELKRPVRIGQTDDIKRRLKEYSRDAWWFRSPTVESFAYIVVLDEKLRKLLEATMIKLVGDSAIFNIQHKI